MTERSGSGVDLFSLYDTWLKESVGKRDIQLREIFSSIIPRYDFQLIPDALSFEKLNKVGSVWALCLDLDNKKTYFPALVHDISLKDNSFIISCQSDKVIFQFTLNGEKGYVFRMIEPNNDLIKELGQVAELLFSSIRDTDSLAEAYKTNLSLSLLILFSKLLDREESDKNIKYLKKRDHFFKLLHLIHTQLFEHLTIKNLSSELDLSVQYLNRLCRLFFGISLSKYIMIRRLEMARILLEHKDYLVKDVAQKCAFKEPDNFIKTFREMYLITPNKFKQRIKEKDLDQESKVDLHRINGFVFLEPIEDEINDVSAIEGEKQFFLVIANGLNETIHCKWLDVIGQVHDQCTLRPNERYSAGSSKDQCWQVFDEKGSIISAYKTLMEPSMILVQTYHDRRCKD